MFYMHVAAIIANIHLFAHNICHITQLQMSQHYQNIVEKSAHHEYASAPQPSLLHNTLLLSALVDNYQ